MNGYLAFDPDRLRFLEAAVRDAVDEMDRWSLRDPEAARAKQLWTRALQHLDTWPPRIRTVAACGALTDLFEWGATGAPAGFSLVRDTLPASSPAELALLRSVLVTMAADPEAGVDQFGEALAELSAHPGQIELLVAEIGVPRLATLVRTWWNVSVPDDDSWVIGATAEPLLTTLHHLGRGIGPHVSLLDDVPPFAATILFAAAADTRSLGPAGADAAAALAQRLADLQTVDPRWRQAMAMVVQGVGAEPATALRFLDGIDDDTLATVVFRTDPAIAGSVLLASNDPTVHAPDAVRSSMLRVATALAELERATGGALSGPTWRPEPYDRRSAELHLFAGGLFDPALPFLPDDLGVYVARYLPQLIAPPVIGRETLVEPLPWDLDGRDDDVTKTIVTAMATDRGSLAVRVAASEFLAFGATTGGNTLDHAAYSAGAVEDAARSAHVDAVERDNAQIEAISALVGFGTNFLETPVGMVTSYGVDAWLGRGVQDIRSVMADAEAEGADVATTVGFSAVVAWRLGHAPGSAPLGRLPEFDDAEVQDRADENAALGLAAVDDWAAALPDDQRAAALDVYRQAYDAAASGTLFVAG